MSKGIVLRPWNDRDQSSEGTDDGDGDGDGDGNGDDDDDSESPARGSSWSPFAKSPIGGAVLLLNASAKVSGSTSGGDVEAEEEEEG